MSAAFDPRLGVDSNAFLHRACCCFDRSCSVPDAESDTIVADLMLARLRPSHHALARWLLQILWSVGGHHDALARFCSAWTATLQWPR